MCLHLEIHMFVCGYRESNVLVESHMCVVQIEIQHACARKKLRLKHVHIQTGV